MKEEIKESLRWLLLPNLPSCETVALEAAKSAMDDLGIHELDQPAWIREHLANWASGSLSNELKSVIQSYILHAHPHHGGLLMGRYFDLHEKLMKNYQLTDDTARRLLNHSFHILELALSETMSASQIGLILETKDESLGVSWRELKYLLKRLSCNQELSVSLVKRQFLTDAEDEVLLFADSSIDEIYTLLQEKAEKLGFPFNLYQLLKELYSPENTYNHYPYLLILHHQCAALAFYDARPSFLYEFSPRGAASLWLLEQYPFLGTGNAFLNNAKSVERCDMTWARSKEDYLSSAKALASVFAGLEQMGFAAKRELAMWLRRLMARIIRLKTETITQIPAMPDNSRICLNVLQQVGANESNTRGVIEQRLVDAVARLIHQEEDGWHARGLGDSVNTTNVSKRKIGDCDFQDSKSHQAIGYETHAGKLSKIYLAEHIRTLKKSLPARIEEWETFSKADNWSVRIVFVAHEFENGLPLSETYEGLNLDFEYLNFGEFFQQADDYSEAELIASFAAHVHYPLNRTNTPQFVREIYTSIM